MRMSTINYFVKYQFMGGSKLVFLPIYIKDKIQHIHVLHVEQRADVNVGYTLFDVFPDGHIIAKVYR